MPRSVMKPVMSRAQVTSKAGLKTGTFLGAARQSLKPPHLVRVPFFRDNRLHD
jgi:hypothetical protein